MRMSGGKTWSPLILAIVLSASASAADTSAIRTRSIPDDREVHAFLADWLHSYGYECPAFEVSSERVPRGADAATICNVAGCTIRIRPESLRASIALGRIEGSDWPQWQNLLLHEAVHYIDIQRRGRYDHGNEFRRLAREFGVAYRP